MTYTVKLKRPLGKDVVIEKVKGHLFPTDSPKNILMLILENEERIFVNIDKFETIWFSDGWFKMEEESAENLKPN